MQPRMRSYLLGTMPEDSRRQIEEEFFDDHAAYEELQDSLNDLIDQYAREELSAGERRQVEDGLLQAERNRVKLQLARALAEREKSDPDPFPIQRTPRIWLWPAAGIAAAIALWFAVGEVRDYRSAPLVAASHPGIASFSLHPQLSRGPETTPQFPAPAAGDLVKVELSSEERFPAYAIEIEAPNRGRIWTQTALTRQANGAIVLWLPGQILTPGSYEFLLYGVRDGERELLGTYPCGLDAGKAAESPTNTKPAQ